MDLFKRVNNNEFVIIGHNLSVTTVLIIRNKDN